MNSTESAKRGDSCRPRCGLSPIVWFPRACARGYFIPPPAGALFLRWKGQGGGAPWLTPLGYEPEI